MRLLPLPPRLGQKAGQRHKATYQSSKRPGWLEKGGPLGLKGLGFSRDPGNIRESCWGILV